MADEKVKVEETATKRVRKNKMFKAFEQEFDMERVENETKILKYLILGKIFNWTTIIDDFIDNYVPNENDKKIMIEFMDRMNNKDFQQVVVDEIIDKRIGDENNE